MSNFDDFDLDLKKVSVDNSDILGPASLTVTTTIVVSLQGKCQSADSPTTGGTGLCCNKAIKADNAPRCI